MSAVGGVDGLLVRGWVLRGSCGGRSAIWLGIEGNCMQRMRWERDACGIDKARGPLAAGGFESQSVL